MTTILTRNQIEERLQKVDLIPLIEQGFKAYSNEQSVIPPVGELQLEKGEVHIKYGFIKQQPYYVIKIASGFYGNAELGLSTSNGCMLVFCQSTGQLKGVLLDEGHLTDVRTAVAGAVTAKALSPSNVETIGIVGTGIQARLQLLFLRSVLKCRNVMVWGRSKESVQRWLANVENESGDDPFQIATTYDLAELQQSCQLIVTTTPSETPLLSTEHVQAGTHITAVGSDMPQKQEVDSEILAKANLIVADSIVQCETRGEISQALRQGKIQKSKIVELGNILSGKSIGRTDDLQITVADLTGVAVQDIQIASAILDG